ncbi:hypothetical protein QVD17_30744 [Tagetes erecta]|uniref:Uncharacterized protein n=1 Tax=Tagetes erecta TaxID=13708 RepID=A0AAD8NNN7_TARER|nr:hypothetical protein QVD17_30744 [Tagetes erecta]
MHRQCLLGLNSNTLPAFAPSPTSLLPTTTVAAVIHYHLNKTHTPFSKKTQFKSSPIYGSEPSQTATKPTSQTSPVSSPNSIYGS